MPANEFPPLDCKVNEPGDAPMLTLTQQLGGDWTEEIVVCTPEQAIDVVAKLVDVFGTVVLPLPATEPAPSTPPAAPESGKPADAGKGAKK